MQITVIGCGRWGTFIAWYLDKIGHDVTLVGRVTSANMKTLMEERKNAYLTIPDTLKLSTDYDSVRTSELTVISVGAQGFRRLMQETVFCGLRDKKVVLCMKGIEIDTGKRLSEVAREYLNPSNAILIWVGPGHVQEFTRGVPNCMVIDSDDDKAKKEVVEAFRSKLIRFYYGTDLIGNEVGAALKNVIGVGAGMLDGLGLSSLKGALMSRATAEVGRLMEHMGGKRISAYGLAHLGDYEATLFSKNSHNRKFGCGFVKGESYQELAEGYYTAAAVHKLCQRYGIEMPISEAVYAILYEKADVYATLDALFERDYKMENE